MPSAACLAGGVTETTDGGGTAFGVLQLSESVQAAAGDAAKLGSTVTDDDGKLEPAAESLAVDPAKEVDH